ncbi:MAG: glycerate kinase [Muribaculaceae bacterium]|nr:glycerate kinase [Muribaculaceae bacterium]
MKKVVVAMDSMKGCLDSLSASRAIASGIIGQEAEVEVICVPVADGGEGTAAALAFGNCNCEKQKSQVSGPLGEEIKVEWYYDEESGTAFIDMAAAAGLALVEESKRDPLRASTFGVGELIMEAVGKGARKVMLGLGGSATVDGGLGALQAMGLIEPEALTPKQTTQEETDTFIKKAGKWGIKLELLCDVVAPFTGERGAARVFGPQKGASAEDVEVLEDRLEEIRRKVKESRGIDLNEVPGSGAAGGLAGGLMAFAGGRIVKGASVVLDTIGFDDIIDGADLIITGEGSSDRQTLMGKLPFEILQRGKRKGIPVWLVAGRVSDEDALLDAGFEKIICINSPEIVVKSNTLGQNPMDPKTGKRRLSYVWRTHGPCVPTD